MDDLVNDEALVKLLMPDLHVGRVADEIGNVVVFCDQHDLPSGVEEPENLTPVMRMTDLVQNPNPKRSLKDDATAAEAFERLAGGGTHQTTFIR